jgi:hypothetical protein
MTPNPDIVCLQELPPNYAWNAEDGDFNIMRYRSEFNDKSVSAWIRIRSRNHGEDTYRLRMIGEWLSEPFDDLQALVDVTAARFWLGDLQ